MTQLLDALETEIQDYNDLLDMVVVVSPDLHLDLETLAAIDDTDPQDLDDLDLTWAANYVDVTPDRRRRFADVSGNARLVALAWLSQALLYSFLIIGML